MNQPQIYIIIAILSLALILVIVYRLKRQNPEKKMTKLAALSFCFIIAGFIFGESRSVGYSLMGVGGLLALIDIVKKIKK